ncbi:Ulp1 protease family [Forsythia ovata]|uniref:Ulp1 protease family n=1 Tax=Forsythia ovata TaxID=205694 RepID=A0ABD1VMH7_9LAMI
MQVIQEEPMEIQLNDDSKIESHPSATVLQSPAQVDVNSAGKVRASNLGPPGKETQSAVHEVQSTENPEPSLIKLNSTNALVIHTIEDDMVFSDEDLITIDESAEQHRLDVREIDAQFNTNWGDVDNVFIPIFMEKRAHWILGHFDVANWHLDVYNSAYKTVRDVAVMDAIQPLLMVIPHLLRQSNVLKFEAPDSPLTSKLCKETPQQTNGLVTFHSILS